MTCLALACAVFPEVHAFHMYLVRGLECMEAPIEAACAKFGARLQYLPHPNLSQYMRRGYYGQHRPNVKSLSFAEVEGVARRTSGCDWVVLGYRLHDSLQRSALIKSGGIVDPKTKRVYPIAPWHARQVVTYIKTHRLPVVPSLGSDDTSGMDLAPRPLLALAERFPRDFARVLEVFPDVEAIVARERFKAERAARAIQIPIGDDPESAAE